MSLRKSPVVQAKLAAAVVTIAVALGFDLDVEVVLAILTVLGASGLFEFSRVSPVPKDDRGLKGAAVEDTQDLIQRQLARER